MPVGPASVFDTLAQAHDEKVCAAVAEIIRSNGPASSVSSIDTQLDLLVTAVGSRIYLLPDLYLPPDVQVPAIFVGPGQTSLTNLTGGEFEAEITVRISMVYNEWRPKVANSDKTVRAALSVIRSAIQDNYTMRVSAYSLVPLVKRIVRWSPITFGLFTAGEPYQVPHVQALEVTFEKNLVAITGAAS